MCPFLACCVSLQCVAHVVIIVRKMLTAFFLAIAAPHSSFPRPNHRKKILAHCKVEHCKAWKRGSQRLPFLQQFALTENPGSPTRKSPSISPLSPFSHGAVLLRPPAWSYGARKSFTGYEPNAFVDWWRITAAAGTYGTDYFDSDFNG